MEKSLHNPAASAENIVEIIKRAIHAPSGDNAQPWKFTLIDSGVQLFNIADRDETLYNFRQRGSLFAHGAVIENMTIAASALGYSTHVALFPPVDGCTAEITFSPADIHTDPLSQYIEKRCTNRKPYEIRQIKPEDQMALMQSVGASDNAILRLVDDDNRMNVLADAISLNERLIMENRGLHDFLFSIIRWSSAQEKSNPGLYVKTMELPAPVEFMFRNFVWNWTFVRLFNMFGFAKSSSKQTAPIYRASSAFGAIVMGGLTNKDFVQAGRCFQRVWLTATSVGLSVQPVTGIPYLEQRIDEGSAGMFSDEHILLIKDAAKKMKETFAVADIQHLAMVFRIGYGGEPSARSSKIDAILI